MDHKIGRARSLFFPTFVPIIFPVSCALKIFVGFTYLLWDKYSDFGDRASADFFVTRQSKIHGCGGVTVDNCSERVQLNPVVWKTFFGPWLLQAKTVCSKGKDGDNGIICERTPDSFLPP